MPIPVSQIVTVNPAVVGTGGNPLSLNAVFLDDGLTTPVSSLLSFPDLESVGDYYGFNSAQYSLAGFYFNGPETASKSPARCSSEAMQPQLAPPGCVAKCWRSPWHRLRPSPAP
jgi:hypothetical protein